MATDSKTRSDGRSRKRLADADLTPQQRAAIEARRAMRQTAKYQAELAHDIEAYQ
jgi:hypothetical protein